MVRKSRVLLRVQHLQKGAGRVAGVVSGQLVHLVQDHHRVGNPAALDAVHNPARHGPYVGAPVPPYLRLVPDAAQADAHVFSVERFCDALTDAGLARARRSHKEQDGARLLFIQSHHRNLLDNPLLRLL